MKSKTLRFYDYINAKFPEFQYKDAIPQSHIRMYTKKPTAHPLVANIPKREQTLLRFLDPVQSEMTPRRCSTPMSHAMRPPIHVQPLPKSFKLKPMTIEAFSMPHAPRNQPKKEEYEEEDKLEEECENDIFLETGVTERLVVTTKTCKVDISTDDEIYEENEPNLECKSFIKIDRTGFPEIPPLAVNLTKLVETMPDDGQASVSPYTLQENIDKLDDEQYEQFIEEDPVILKSCKESDEGFSPIEFGNFVSCLESNKYKITISVATAQFLKVANIYNNNMEYLKCKNYREFADKFEKHICQIFGCRTALLWRYSKVNHALINYSHLIKYPDRRGFLGACIQEKRQIIAPNPLNHPLFDETYDLPLCEEADMIAAIPIIENEEPLGCVLMIDKVHESGAEFLYWPHSDIYLLKLYNSLLPRVFKKFTYEVEGIGKDMNFFSKINSKKYNIQHLISEVILTFCNELSCDSCSLLIRFDIDKHIDRFGMFDFSGNQLNMRLVSNSKFGISEDSMNNNKIINLLKGKDHPLYNKNIDEDCCNTSVLILPIVCKNIVHGTCICRAKKNAPFFSEKDIRHATKMITEFSNVFSDALSIQEDSKILKSAVSGQNKLASLLQTAESLESEIDIESLIERIILNSKNLVEADRGSLFISNERKTHLISKVAHGTDQIIIPSNSGLVGTAFISNESINIQDVYQDSRFNSSVDKKTGYRTKSLLTIPITDQKGNVIAVTQLMNKKDGKAFTKSDVELTKAMNVFTGIALNNSKSIADANAISIKTKALLTTAKALSSESTSLILHQIIQTVLSVIGCERVIFRSPGDKGATKYVIYTKKAVKMDDVNSDPRYENVKESNFTVQSIIAVPVNSIGKGIIHVLELQNKKPGINSGLFSNEDVKIASSFASYIGIAIDNNARNSDYISLPSVFLDEKIAKETSLPPSLVVEIGNQGEDILGMTEIESILVIINIFSSLNLMKEYKITINSIVTVLLRLKSYVSLQRVASGLHLLYCILKTDIKHIFDSNNVLAMVLSVLVVKFDFDKGSEYSSHENVVQRDIALNVIFAEPSYKMKLCEFSASLYENFLELDYPMWDNITTCLIGSDPLNHFKLISDIWSLVKPINQVRRNISVVMQSVVKLCSFSDLIGPFIRSEEWAKARNISTTKMICFIEMYVFPFINAISEAIPQTKSISDKLQGNLSQFISKCVLAK